MGSRGKKRRRADGSVASGKIRSEAQFASGKNLEPVKAVSPGALADAVAILHRYAPLTGPDDRNYGAMEDSMDEIEALAERQEHDGFALGLRAEKLANYLRRAPDLYSSPKEADLIVVDPSLLQFAATTELTGDDKPLSWTDQ